jgi:hypothetical protein
LITHIQARKSGTLVADAWGSVPELTAAGVRAAATELLGSDPKAQEADYLLLARATKPPRALDGASDDRQTSFSENQRGLFGYLITDKTSAVRLRVSPVELIGTNRSFQKYVEVHAGKSGVTMEKIRSGEFQVAMFPTEISRVDVDSDSPPVPLFRGVPLVSESWVTKPFMEDLLQSMADYLLRSVHPNGRMMYVYYPSRGEEDTIRNNSVRQWMATRALIHIARRHPMLQRTQAIDQNIQYNLAATYREQGDFGWIEERGKIKLGAIALAAMSLRDYAGGIDYSETRQKLCRTVRSMWLDSGKFRTFLAPADRDDCHNFYPGEALLLWADMLHESMDKSLLDCFSRSFYFYGDWHRQNRNPAFVPWHTMAYARLWGRLPDQKLVDAIFEMNDWLLGIQQWEDAPYEDCRGRFYAPDRPFGPPHASSTAVYLEGLAEAFRIARLTGDQARQVAYRRAILRGLRSLAQLTYKGDIDMCFHAKRKWLLGGVRTCEYNNVIRVDNVQHSIMAILSVLSIFEASDWDWIS